MSKERCPEDMPSTAQTKTQQEKRRRDMTNKATTELSSAPVKGCDGGAAGSGGTSGGDGGVGPTRMFTLWRSSSTSSMSRSTLPLITLQPYPQLAFAGGTQSATNRRTLIACRRRLVRHTLTGYQNNDGRASVPRSAMHVRDRALGWDRDRDLPRLQAASIVPSR